jgi:hypothetical protein
MRRDRSASGRPDRGAADAVAVPALVRGPRVRVAAGVHESSTCVECRELAAALARAIELRDHAEKRLRPPKRKRRGRRRDQQRDQQKEVPRPTVDACANAVGLALWWHQLGGTHTVPELVALCLRAPDLVASHYLQSHGVRLAGAREGQNRAQQQRPSTPDVRPELEVLQRKYPSRRISALKQTLAHRHGRSKKTIGRWLKKRDTP